MQYGHYTNENIKICFCWTQCFSIFQSHHDSAHLQTSSYIVVSSPMVAQPLASIFNSPRRIGLQQTLQVYRSIKGGDTLFYDLLLQNTAHDNHREYSWKACVLSKQFANTKFLSSNFSWTVISRSHRGINNTIWTLSKSCQMAFSNNAGAVKLTTNELHKFSCGLFYR